MLEVVRLLFVHALRPGGLRDRRRLLRRRRFLAAAQSRAQRQAEETPQGYLRAALCGPCEMLTANSRTPEERLGDIDAQVGANAVGIERLAAMADAPMHEVIDYGERRMRADPGAKLHAAV